MHRLYVYIKDGLHYIADCKSMNVNCFEIRGQAIAFLDFHYPQRKKASGAPDTFLGFWDCE